jgi:KDO2-lipid IV(A) lauroyltransferase
MMSKSRSRCQDLAVFWAVRFIVCFVQAVPASVSRALGLFLGWLAYHLDRRHRLVALENLQHAFPDRDLPSREQSVQAVYRHFGTMIMEMILLPRKLHPNNWRHYLHLQDGRLIVAQLLSSRPLLLVTGHFGNWEMAGYSLGMFGFPAHAVARPLDNPYLDEFLRRFRERTGQRILAKKGDFDQMQAILDQGGVLGTLADQDAGQRGLFVDFFGRPASTHKAIALLALQHQVPLLVLGSKKVGEPMRYEVIVRDLILPEDYSNEGNAVRAITQRLTTALEHVIRAAPDQYLWLHRRWKHQPAQARRQAA